MTGKFEADTNRGVADRPDGCAVTQRDLGNLDERSARNLTVQQREMQRPAPKL